MPGPPAPNGCCPTERRTRARTRPRRPWRCSSRRFRGAQRRRSAAQRCPRPRADLRPDHSGRARGYRAARGHAAPSRRRRGQAEAGGTADDEAPGACQSVCAAVPIVSAERLRHRSRKGYQGAMRDRVCAPRRVRDLRCPESVGIIRVASGDGEQEMIAEFFPQIQDSTENDASSRSGGLGCQTWHGLSSPWLGILEAIG